jgi:hypothetical protein
LLLACVDEHRARAVDEERAQVAVAAFGDAAQVALEPAGVLARSEAEVAGEMLSRREASNISDEGDQGGRDQQSDSRDGAQMLERGELLGGGLELAFHLLHPCLNLADLPARLGKDRPRCLGQGRSEIAISKTAFATSTAMRVSFDMMGSSFALNQQRLWH